eukprot:CAMPEP_0182592204 /NCGR_PEP_ID=MMETSP1324-20130603/75444_1 /TAXON_ID=236786 /ORGANISM="Florenciella sp., Strain RCC1587" /LENGTH=166 /DNA_ID=CAMNT_0024809581 /DNA_START=24 /DNA_END=521 /DNA_ORIENTATION=+
MSHVAANLSIHDTIIAKAKEIFAAWRTEKEQVTNRELVIAACLISAHRQLSQQVARDEAAKRLEDARQAAAAASAAEASEKRKRRYANVSTVGNGIVDAIKRPRGTSSGAVPVPVPLPIPGVAAVAAAGGGVTGGTSEAKPPYLMDRTGSGTAIPPPPSSSSSSSS